MTQRLSLSLSIGAAVASSIALNPSAAVLLLARACLAVAIVATIAGALVAIYCAFEALEEKRRAAPSFAG